MIIEYQGVCTEQLRDLNLKLDLSSSVLISDEHEERATDLLKCLIYPEYAISGDIFIDGVLCRDFLKKHTITEIFGYVFDTGIMLSNLSIRENLALPYRLRFPQRVGDEFSSEIREWLCLFDLELDLELRPAFVKASILKELCFIRTLMLKPRVLIIDNPLYLLNRFERENLMRILIAIKENTPILIASTDLEAYPQMTIKTLYWNSKQHGYTEKQAKA